MTTALIVIAAVIVVGLAAYAGWLHYRLWQLKNRHAAPRVQSFDPGVGNSDSGQMRLRKTLYLLSDALINDKMTHTEGCLRICAMANNLEQREQFRREYGVLFRVAEATGHFPILDEWQALSREEQRRITTERRAIEEKYGDAVIEAAHRVRETMRDK